MHTHRTNKGASAYIITSNVWQRNLRYNPQVHISPHQAHYAQREADQAQHRAGLLQEDGVHQGNPPQVHSKLPTPQQPEMIATEVHIFGHQEMNTLFNLGSLWERLLCDETTDCHGSCYCYPMFLWHIPSPMDLANAPPPSDGGLEPPAPSDEGLDPQPPPATLIDADRAVLPSLTSRLTASFRLNP